MDENAPGGKEQIRKGRKRVGETSERPQKRAAHRGRSTERRPRRRRQGDTE